ncbi:MAG: ABC transporter ATP-binding protein [Gemmatimonadetes bacterium]|nr:ABC transporter ATP-binding protein [Gemmatimonadota bacterium]
MSALLEVEDLRTWFFTDQGVARAVDGVSFQVREGETVGIVGESGCGKTVTSLSLMRLVPAPPGRIMEGSSVRLRGEELVGAPEKRMRALRGNDISMVFQEPMTSLNPVFTVGSQIGETLRLHMGLSRRQARERTVEALREVGIPEPAQRYGEYPHQLSGGMRQRVMIAMALATGPGLLIADEPTTALDVTIQAQILELLAGLQERRRMGVLLITHDLGVVAEVCDRVVVMYAGQVVEQGTVREVFQAPAHPYTEGLLASLPRVDEPGTRLRPIPGTVPPSHAWPPACRFADRCPYAWQRCLTDPPPLRGVAGGAASGVEPDAPALADAHPRAARCWLVEEPERRAVPHALER